MEKIIIAAVLGFGAFGVLIYICFIGGGNDTVKRSPTIKPDKPWPRNRKPVFFSDCVYFSNITFGHTCNDPSELKNAYLRKYSVTACSKKNENNDCLDFKAIAESKPAPPPAPPRSIDPALR